MSGVRHGPAAAATVRPAPPGIVGPPHAGEALVRTWRPIDPATGGGDVAILEPCAPLPGEVRIPPLHRPDRPWGHRFRILGFPAGMQDGVWSGGVFRDRQGTRWLQLEADPHSPPIAQGFSGAPVWDEAHDALGLGLSPPDVTRRHGYATRPTSSGRCSDSWARHPPR